MSSDQDIPTTIRFRASQRVPDEVQQALEELAIAIADAETDDVEGFRFDLKGSSIALPRGSFGSRPADSLCIGFTMHENGGTSCLVEWH